MRLASRFGRYNSIYRERLLTDDELMQLVLSVFLMIRVSAIHTSQPSISSTSYVMKVPSRSLPVRVGFVICDAANTHKHMSRLCREGNINGKEVPEIDGPRKFSFCLHKRSGVGNNSGEICVPHKGYILGGVSGERMKC